MSWHRYDGITLNTMDDSNVMVCDPIFDIGDIGTLDIRLPRGYYSCFYNITNDEFIGQKIAASMILRRDLESIWASSCLLGKGFSVKNISEKIRCVSGIAGFVIGDRASMDWADNWRVFEKGLAKSGNVITHRKDDDFFDQAYFTSAGMGEGEYRVQVVEYKGTPVGIVLIFIG